MNYSKSCSKSIHSNNSYCRNQGFSLVLSSTVNHILTEFMINDRHAQLILIIIPIFSYKLLDKILFLVSLATLECAITLHHEDFIVTNFGMKNGNLSLLFKALQECLMILHWVTKDIRHMFSTLTREFSKYPLPKVVQIRLIFQQIKSFAR